MPVHFTFDDNATLSLRMGELITFSIHGTPLYKQRSARGRNGNQYNPSKRDEAAFRSAVDGLLSDRLGRIGLQRPHFAAGVSLTVHALYQFPQSSNHKLPDIDNLLKFTLDALGHGFLYQDDCQVVRVYASKARVHGLACGRTTVTIEKC